MPGLIYYFCAFLGTDLTTAFCAVDRKIDLLPRAGLLGEYDLNSGRRCLTAIRFLVGASGLLLATFRDFTFARFRPPLARVEATAFCLATLRREHLNVSALIW